MNDYSPPELNTERRICRRIRAQVLRDPCGHCTHRQMVFGKAICSGATGRNFLTCTRDMKEPTFALDEATLTKAETA